MANVYLKITDMHKRQTNFDGRYDYKKETRHADMERDKVIAKYQEQGHDVYLIFGGDIYDRSYNEVFDAVVENNEMIALRNRVSGIYVTLGNHEVTYYKDNPFWTLVADVKSERIKKQLKKVWQPRGVFNVVELIDELIDGDVRFIFNHYGTDIVRPPSDGKTNIGLFHQDLYAKAISDNMSHQLGHDIFEHSPVYFDKNGALNGYHYAFLGHMHMLYGKYKYVDDISNFQTWLYYLSSTGRTNHLEVNNNFLERNYPAIIVEDGKLVGVEDNLFNLMSREECVDEELVAIKQQKRKENKAKDALALDHVSVTDDPITNIRLALTPHAGYLGIYEDLLEKPVTKLEQELDELYEEVRWG